MMRPEHHLIEALSNYKAIRASMKKLVEFGPMSHIGYGRGDIEEDLKRFKEKPPVLNDKQWDYYNQLIDSGTSHKEAFKMAINM